MKQFILLTLLLTSISLFCKPNGSWRQVFPEENGEVPPRALGNIHMCSIGDQQAIIIGSIGVGGGRREEQTWLYDYKINKWTKLNTNWTPDTYYTSGEGGNFLYQISNLKFPFGYNQRTSS